MKDERYDIEKIRDEFQIMIGEDELTPLYEEAHKDATEKLRDEIDLPTDTYIEVFEYLSDFEAEKPTTHLRMSF